MARYKPVHKGLKLLAVDFDRQVLPGSFEHALCHLIDHELDLQPFHARYQNDDSGAPAFNPAALLKMVVCDRQGLIGREMFAIDGVKLPSNASKAKSGTRKDYQRQLTKMQAAAKKIVDQHRQADTAPSDAAVARREAKKLARLQREAQQLRTWLAKITHDRKGA